MAFAESVKLTTLACVAALGAVVIGLAAPASATELLLNGGFEGGVTPDAGGGSVPSDWTPNSGYTSTGFNLVTSNPGQVNSGSQALQIGNLDSQTLATLSQTMSVVPVV